MPSWYCPRNDVNAHSPQCLSRCPVSTAGNAVYLNELGPGCNLRANRKFSDGFSSSSASTTSTRLRMSLPFSTILLCVYLFCTSTRAAAIPQLTQRKLNVGTTDTSHYLSTEALLTLIGVCVAVLGVALTIILKWAGLKNSFGGIYFPYRGRLRSRSGPASMAYLLLNACPRC